MGTRYLINAAYIGTRFRGSQLQITADSKFRGYDPTTVQGMLESGLRTLKPTNLPIAVLASRTDKGVHALHATLHVDLERYNDRFHPLHVTGHLNKYFQKAEVPIRISKTYIVPDTFHCRHNVISRTYLYRFAFIKRIETCQNNFLLRHIPIEEVDRCLFVSSETFDIDKMRETSKLFLGLHDFRSFMGKGSQDPNKITRRIIDKIEVTEGRPICNSEYSWPYCVDGGPSDYKYYQVVVKSSGFLYNQVRRTVACLLAVAQGERVTVERARGTPRGRDQWSSRNDHRSHDRYGPPTRTNYRLIVENLSSRISWQDLKDYMRQAGEVTYADAHKQHRNEGVVEFASFSDLKNAIEKLDDTELNGRRIHLVEDKSSKRKQSGSASSSRSRSRSKHSSRSRSRSKSPNKPRDSRSHSPKKSVDRSRSNSRKKSVERRSKSPRLDAKRSREASKNRSHSRSRSPSKHRSKSRSRSRSQDN